MSDSVAIKKLLTVAQGELGYEEKASNASLDDKHANKGYNNWTKYGRDLVKWIGSPYSNGVPYCDMYADWCFITAFGLETAKQMIGGWSAYTPTSAQYYKNIGRWFTTPEPGDQIFFKNSKEIFHTGLVYKVDDTYVYTYEANTSPGDGTVVDNGGGVYAKRYLRSHTGIAGYGRAKWDLYKETREFKPNDILTRGQCVTMLYALCGRPDIRSEIPFVDVAKNAYFRKAVEWAYAKGITSGTSDTKFSPNDPVTRGQFAVFLWAISGKPTVEQELKFADVAENKYYAKAIKWLVKYNLVSGFPDNTFRPDDRITRAQACTIIYACQGKPTATGSVPFVDVKEGSYYYDAVRWCYRKGIASGY